MLTAAVLGISNIDITMADVYVHMFIHMYVLDMYVSICMHRYVYTYVFIYVYIYIYIGMLTAGVLKLSNIDITMADVSDKRLHAAEMFNIDTEVNACMYNEFICICIYVYICMYIYRCE
jgi:hypothetical protein